MNWMCIIVVLFFCVVIILILFFFSFDVIRFSDFVLRIVGLWSIVWIKFKIFRNLYFIYIELEWYYVYFKIYYLRSVCNLVFYDIF